MISVFVRLPIAALALLCLRLNLCGRTAAAIDVSISHDTRIFSDVRFAANDAIIFE
jgi:hypothetical protein